MHSLLPSFSTRLSGGLWSLLCAFPFKPSRCLRSRHGEKDVVGNGGGDAGDAGDAGGSQGSFRMPWRGCARGRSGEDAKDWCPPAGFSGFGRRACRRQNEEHVGYEDEASFGILPERRPCETSCVCQAI